MRFLIAFVAPISIVAAGCGSSTYCDLAGCASSLAVDVPALGTDEFTVDFETSTFSGTVRCPAVDENDGESGDRGEPLATTGDISAAALAEDDPLVFVASCTARGVRVGIGRRGVDPRDALPAAAAITVTSDAQTFAATDDGIEYGVNQPNGPDCAPTCLFATLVAE